MILLRMLGWCRVKGWTRKNSALVDTEGQAALNQLYVCVDRTWIRRTMGVHRISLYGYSLTQRQTGARYPWPIIGAAACVKKMLWPRIAWGK